VRGSATEGLTVGAGVLLSDVCADPLVTATFPVVARSARLVSTPVLRNTSTIGGNLLIDTRCNYYDQTYEWRKSIRFCLKKDGDTCWVAPGGASCWAVQSSDLAPVMVALDARLRFVGPGTDRWLAAADLYAPDGIQFLRKAPGELLTEIFLPPAHNLRAAYHKLRRRGGIDFPVLGVAAAAALADDGTVARARVVLGSIAPAPLLVAAAEAALVGRRLDADRIAEAAEASFRAARPLDNTDFVMGWRKQMVRPFTVRALQELAADAAGVRCGA
jgi:4-hydroxybenzoyl-CoA reductase subunit beta